MPPFTLKCVVNTAAPAVTQVTARPRAVRSIPPASLSRGQHAKRRRGKPIPSHRPSPRCSPDGGGRVVRAAADRRAAMTQVMTGGLGRLGDLGLIAPLVAVALGCLFPPLAELGYALLVPSVILMFAMTVAMVEPGRLRLQEIWPVVGLAASNLLLSPVLAAGLVQALGLDGVGDGSSWWPPARRRARPRWWPGCWACRCGPCCSRS